VTYRLASAAAARAFAATGAMVVRAPAGDDALGAWVASLQDSLVSGAEEPDRQPVARDTPDLAAGAVTPRRFDDAALTAIAGLHTISCECPCHVAELLMQLLKFEA
jgi:hypothetical protein